MLRDLLRSFCLVCLSCLFWSPAGLSYLYWLVVGLLSLMVLASTFWSFYFVYCGCPCVRSSVPTLLLACLVILSRPLPPFPLSHCSPPWSYSTPFCCLLHRSPAISSCVLALMAVIAYLVTTDRPYRDTPRDVFPLHSFCCRWDHCWRVGCSVSAQRDLITGIALVGKSPPSAL